MSHQIGSQFQAFHSELDLAGRKSRHLDSGVQADDDSQVFEARAN